uniref:Retinoic acid receptor responder 3-like n=1 Tax=Tetraodon nigroviridis TaxID=99883 RepID=H3DHB6_TETNG
MAPVRYDKKPEVGDLIDINRGSYHHWAVYVGDGCVVHLAPPCEAPGGQSASVMSVLTDRALVKKEELWVVVGNDKWKINNILDDKYEPRPGHIIAKEACALVGQEWPYCVIRGNCEHFVTELRYGKAESRQVRQVLTAGVGAAVAVVAAAALAGLLFGGSRKENKNT